MSLLIIQQRRIFLNSVQLYRVTTQVHTLRCSDLIIKV